MTAINPIRLDRKRKLTRYAIREHGGNILFMLPAFALFAFVCWFRLSRVFRVFYR